MGKMIYVTEKCKKPKKKPGWQEAAAQEAEWLQKINSMKLFAQPGKKYQGKVVPSKKIDPVVDGTLPSSQRQQKVGKSLDAFIVGTGTKPITRPEVMYKDDPELTERERKARARKFNTAPAYNKGPDVFVTEEELSQVLKGNKRRS